jgi:type I restriction enzyme R subunit
VLARFVHLAVEEKAEGTAKVRKETLVFPRYHQLDAVRRLLAAAREGRGATT